MSNPDFENLLKVLRREVPKRPTLFEFFLNGPFYEKLAGKKLGKEGKDWKWGGDKSSCNRGIQERWL